MGAWRRRALVSLLRRLRLHWLRDAAVSASLGHRRADALRLAAFHTAIALAPVLRLPMPRPLRVRLAPDGHQVLIGDGGELAVLAAILLEGEYQSAGRHPTIRRSR